jgi:hypothetical protein
MKNKLPIFIPAPPAGFVYVGYCIPDHGFQNTEIRAMYYSPIRDRWADTAGGYSRCVDETVHYAIREDADPTDFLRFAIHLEQKPTLSVLPENLWIESRVAALQNAIMQRVQSYQTVPQEWITELNKHNETLSYTVIK